MNYVTAGLRCAGPCARVVEVLANGWCRDCLQARAEEGLRAQLAVAQAVIGALLDEHGFEHDDPGCPEDSDCTCPNIQKINEAMKGSTWAP